MQNSKIQQLYKQYKENVSGRELEAVSTLSSSINDDNVSEVRKILNSLTNLEKKTQKDILTVQIGTDLRKRYEQYKKDKPLNGQSFQTQRKKLLERIEDEDNYIKFNLKTEQNVSNSGSGNSNVKPTFYRYANRESFLLKNGLQIDLSKVSSSEILGEWNSSEYELEYEFTESLKGTVANVVLQIREVQKQLYMVLMKTKHFLTFGKVKSVVKNYMSNTLQTDFQTDAIFGEKIKKEPKSIFWGSQPTTLEQKNVVQYYDEPFIGNGDYTVTEKADGLRVQLYIDKLGTLYEIDMSLTVKQLSEVGQFKKFKETLFDCEKLSILNGDGIEEVSFGIFECYLTGGKIFDEKAFKPFTERLKVGSSFVSEYSKTNCPKDTNAKVFVKKFYKHGDQKKDIFQLSKLVLDESKKLPYQIDGLIYTPENVPFVKGTWKHLLKWKDQSQNSIDFLCPEFKPLLERNNEQTVCELFSAYNQNENGKIDLIEGQIRRKAPYINYKTPFVPKTIDCQELGIPNYIILPIDKRSGKPCFKDHNTGLKTLIQPNSIVEMRIQPMAKNNSQIQILNGIQQGNYKYRWVPLRIREDKTDLYRRNGQIVGSANTYSNAMQIISSTLYPVSVEVITGMKTLSKEEVALNVSKQGLYYNRKASRQETGFKEMVDFHNVVVKRGMLIGNVLENYPRVQNLFDMACGQFGDLLKYFNQDQKSSKLRFIYGVDLVENNITNQQSGALSRYLNMFNKVPKEERRTFPRILINIGDFNQDLTARDGYIGEKAKTLYDITFQRNSELDINHKIYEMYPEFKQFQYMEGLIKSFMFFNGKLQQTDIFDCISIQFAIHYAFKDATSFKNMCKNLNNFLANNGIIIGTTMNGQKVQDLLGKNNSIERRDPKTGTLYYSIERKQQVDKSSKSKSKTITKSKTKATKNPFGNSIDVYIRTINTVNEEYLVDFGVLDSELEQYGIYEAPPETLKLLGLSKSKINFDEIHKEERFKNGGKEYKDILKSMNEVQREYSFLNTLFVYQKKTNF